MNDDVIVILLTLVIRAGFTRFTKKAPLSSNGSLSNTLRHAGIHFKLCGALSKAV